MAYGGAQTPNRTGQRLVEHLADVRRPRGWQDPSSGRELGLVGVGAAKHPLASIRTDIG